MSYTTGDDGQHYVLSGQKYLRCGYTTGTCAAAAAKAAAIAYFSRNDVASVEIATPKGWQIAVPVTECAANGAKARAAVRKDAGDDHDCTDACIIVARLHFLAGGSSVRISIDGGTGVGRVTKPGLELPEGEAAINAVPRGMIAMAVGAVCAEHGFCGSVRIVIEVPDGERIAKSTFNPQLGIEGGISILGTSGIVEPQSARALLDALEVEARQISVLYGTAEFRPLLVTPGNYGAGFVAEYPALGDIPVLKCANFIGAALDLCAAHSFTHVLLVGHAGKLVKLAGGIMDTHSRTADCRMELFALHAALSGAPQALTQTLMDCMTSGQCVDTLRAYDAAHGTLLHEQTAGSLMRRIDFHIKRRAAQRFQCEALLFTGAHGVLGMTGGAEKMLETMRHGHLP